MKETTKDISRSMPWQCDGAKCRSRRWTLPLVSPSRAEGPRHHAKGYHLFLGLQVPEMSGRGPVRAMTVKLSLLGRSEAESKNSARYRRSARRAVMCPRFRMQPSSGREEFQKN